MADDQMKTLEQRSHLQALDKVRDELAKKWNSYWYSDAKDKPVGASAYRSFIEGFDAALQALSEAAGEFDHMAAFKQASTVEIPSLSFEVSFEQGARWQFEQDRARIGAALAKDSEQVGGVCVHCASVKCPNCADLTARLEQAERERDECTRHCEYLSKAIAKRDIVLNNLRLYIGEEKWKELFSE